MRLEGIHHITAITGDAPRNLDFYTRVMGLRLTAKTVNQDDPTVYHLFYADEQGRPGSELTFFEYPGAIAGPRGRRDGPHDRLARRLPRGARLLGAPARAPRASRPRAPPTRCGSPTSRASRTSWRCAPASMSRWPAEHPEIPLEHALQGFDAVRAYTADPGRSAPLLEKVLSAVPAGDGAWELRGERRGGRIEYDPAPVAPGRQSAGTVHHVAWGTSAYDHPHWLKILELTGVPNSGVIDRHYFHSIYFREPSGVLFEIADDAPGFTVDVPLEQLGSVVILPPRLEPHREEIERRLTPLPDPRAGWATHPLGGAAPKIGVQVWGCPR